MSRFLDMVAADLDRFMGLDEFATLHTVDGREMRITMDDETLRKQQAELGIAESGLLFYAQEPDLPTRKAPGSTVTVDDVPYIVDDWRVDMGIVTISCHISTGI